MELMFILLAEGRTEEALREGSREPGDSRLMALAIAEFAHGHRARADTALAQFQRSQGAVKSFLSMIYALRGDPDRAFTLLDEAFQYSKTHVDTNLCFIKSYLPWQPLRSQPRYKAFVHKMNLPE